VTREIVSNRKQDWATPQHLVDQWAKEFDLNTDLCAMDYNKKLPLFINPDEDSLSKPWAAPTRGFCNPPYGDVGAWLRQGILSCAAGAFSLFLVPANTDTLWFHEYAKHGQIDLFKGRIAFEDCTPPALEVERLMRMESKKPSVANARKIAHRLYLIMQDDGTPCPNAVEHCSRVLGTKWWIGNETEKQGGAGFPVMLVAFDPDAPGGPKPFRTRDAKTGLLL